MTEISAQVSLYSSDQEGLRSTFNEVLRIFQSREVKVIPGSMSLVAVGSEELVITAVQSAFRHVSGQERVVMVVTFSNSRSILEKTRDDIVTFKAIGYVQNAFPEPDLPEKISDGESRIILNPELLEGLQGIEPGNQIVVLFYFHQSEGYDLLQHPRGDRTRPVRGVFSLRSPRRPNPIGMTVVDLIDIEGNVLRVRGLDAINGTPILDLKLV